MATKKRKAGEKKGEQQHLGGLAPDVDQVAGRLEVKTITVYPQRPNKVAKAKVAIVHDGEEWSRDVDMKVPKKVEEALVEIALERARAGEAAAPEEGGDE